MWFETESSSFDMKVILKCNDDSMDICVAVVYSDEYCYSAGIDILYANASDKEIWL